MRKLILFLFTILLFGCCLKQPQQTLPIARIGLHLAPATFGQSISVQQHLIIEHPGRTDQLDTVLQINPQQLNLVGLAFNKRVMTLQYDGKTLRSWRLPMLPKEVRGEDVLEDLELALWPGNALRHALPVSWRIEQNNLQRKVLLNDIPIMVINYSNKIRWEGKIVLTNLRYHYRLTILSTAF